MNAPVRTRQTPARETDVASAPSTGPVRRRVRQGTDRYAFDQSIVPDGFVYQWKRHSILGQEDPAYMAELHQLGFDPVPAERHDGLFLPVGTKGPIIIGGQILMERHVENEREARWEDKKRADDQVNGSRQQFGLPPAANSRFAAESAKSRAVTGVRVGREVVDAPRPKYQIDEE